MKQVQDAYIVAIKRTPVGKAPRGMFKNTRPDDLLAHSIRATLAETPSVDPERIEDFVVGCAMPEGPQGQNVARIAALLAGLPDRVPAVTVNRFCSSGVQSIAMAADRIRTGDCDLVMAGGTETMSMVPMMGNGIQMNPAVFQDDNVAIAYGMGITAEKVSEQWDVSREQQDAFALNSHRKALAAIEAGHFAAEIAPYTIEENHPDLSTGEVASGQRLVDTDEGPRADTSLEGLARLRPVFRGSGTVTAGNASQMSDGAGAVLLASEQALKDYDLTPMARFVSFAVAGVPPEIMGIGPIKAIPIALQRAGLTKEQIDWIELNEAFAAQALAVIKDVDLDPDKVNPYGGAIALGHPLGATGTLKAATALYGLQRTQKQYGMVTMCIGTGMGAAGIFEAV